MEKIIEIIKKYHLYFLITVVLGISLVNTYFIFMKEEEKEEINPLPTKQEIISDEFYVDIKGYIKNPGVYLVNENTLVNDLIKMAGGLAKNGTTSNLNLSKKLSDEMVIIVNSKKELEKKEVIVIKEECVCETVTINECLELPKEKSSTTSKISLNKGTLDELMTLTGIGESKAKAIISYREENGLFNVIEDVMKVSGIGESVFAKIKENITT